MTELTVQPLHPAVGAEVGGLDPSVPLDADTLRQLRQLFDDRGVLVFRDLDIDARHQHHLVWSLIGEEPPEDPRPPTFVSNREDGGAAPYGRLLFHCDMMWAERPEPVVSLYGLQVAPPTVPTLFVNMAHAWSTLPDDLRERVEGLAARHGHEHHYPNRGGDEDVIDTYYEDPHSSVKPIGFSHPRTGATLLYVSQQVTMHIVGLPADENEALLEELFSHLYAPANVARHDWRTGDLVVWDNVTIQHARGNVNLDGPARTLRKVIGPVYVSAADQRSPTFSKVASSSGS